MFKRALVSTSDKTGLLEFLKPFCAQGCEIVSTGGTSKFLRENGVKVVEVGEATGFPEVMDGRVRTLHPKIHMGLLARSYVPDDMALLQAHGVEPFDLLVVNLYPFEAAFKKGLKGEELIEQIDIGGPSMLRAAAKSFERVTVVCDPGDYSLISKKVDEKTLDKKFRQKLAVKVFEHCSFYDGIVAHALREDPWEEAETITVPLRRKQLLRYGENPHQKAVWYESPFQHDLGLSAASILQGKELSYNNILDLEAAVGVVADFEEPACAIIKHLSPCGVATDKSVEGAYQKAFEADSISAFGGIVAINRALTASLAEAIVGPFLECVIAPEIDSGALKILSAKKNLRVLALKNFGLNRSARIYGHNGTHQDTRPPESQWGDDLEVKSLRGGALIQAADRPSSWQSQWRIIGQSPDDTVKADLLFAQKVVRHIKSNGISVVKNGQTLGLCGGQTNRIDSVRWALERAKGRGTELVLGSDAFFPFRDSIDMAAASGVRWIIQPGGSLRDAEVEKAAREHGLNMIITGTRHFKH